MRDNKYLLILFFSFSFSFSQTIINTESLLREIDSSFVFKINTEADLNFGNIDLIQLNNALSVGKRFKNNLFRISFGHEYISEEKETISKKEVKSVLKLIGETTPVESIIQFHSEEPESHELRDSAKELDQGTIEVATRMFESLKSQGMNKETAVKQIFNIQPFNEYPELIQYFN